MCVCLFASNRGQPLCFYLRFKINTILYMVKTIEKILIKTQNVSENVFPFSIENFKNMKNSCFIKE